MRKLCALVIVFIFLLVGSALANEQKVEFTVNEDVNTPNPTITVTYLEEDAPIVLDTSSLGLFYDFGGIRNPVLDENNNQVISIIDSEMEYQENSPGLGAKDKFIFKVDKFLPDGNYVFVVKGNKYDERSENNLGKDHLLEVSFTVDAESMLMWISKPNIPFILPKENQDVAVGDSDQFTLEITTLYETTCSIQREPVIQKDPSQYYVDGDKFNYGSQEPTTVHEILVVDSSYTQYDGDDTVLSIFEPFNYQTYDRNSNYLIVCKQEQANGQAIYHQKVLYVGYDLSPPEFDVRFIPNRLIDQNDLSTSLNISSREDFVACNYRFIEQPSVSVSGKDLSMSPIWLKRQFSGIADYTTLLEESFDMGNGLLDGTFAYVEDQEYVFKAEIQCQNLAQQSTTKEAIFYVQLDDTVRFSVINEGGFTLYGAYHNYTEESPEIHVRTNLLSTCQYIYNGVSTQISEEATRDHIFTFDNEENDIYGAEIFLLCEVPTTNNFYSGSIVIAKDSNPPKSPTFLNEDFTCDGGIGIDIQAPVNEYITKEYGSSQSYGNGDKVRYKYALYEEENLLAAGQTEEFVGYQVRLDENSFGTPLGFTSNDFNKNYRWDVTAIDGAGQESATSSINIQRLENNHPRCDTQTPTGSHEAILGPTGYEVRLNCEDPEGNCATNILYAQLPLGSTCDEESLSSIDASASISFEEDALLCYQVFDLAQPNNYYSPLYSVEITPEVNIQFVSPLSGIASQDIFTFEFITPSRNNRQLSCKHGPASVAVQDLFEQRNYQGIYELSFLEDVDGDGRNHRIAFDASAASIIGGLFDETADKDIQNWVIACKETGVDVYPVKFFEFGFDTTSPVIRASVDPELVENPLNMSAKIDVEVDELSYCQYADTINKPSVYKSFIPGVFEDFDSYQLKYNTTEVYTDQDFLDVNQEIVCYNRAGLFSSYTVEYRVEATGDLNIEFDLEEFYDEQYVAVEVRTPGQWSDCEMSIDGSEYENFNGRTGEASLDYTHEHQVSLEDGEHQLAVKCTSWFNSEVGYAYENILIDSQEPRINIEARNPTCSQDTIYANVVTDGTGSDITVSEFSLKDQEGNILASGPFSAFELIIPNVELELESSYILQIYVEDQVGKNASSQVNIVAATQENAACDITPPTSSLQTRDTYWGKEFIVSCSDEETSCTDSFYYYFDESGACLFNNAEEVQVANYIEQQLLGEKSNTFCYYVIDEGLNPSEKKSFSYELIDTCYNGLYDPNEAGVDCGGVCALNDCGICRNNEYDEAWEESKDCGGVCSSFCSDGGIVPLQIEVLQPQNGVSLTRDFSFSIGTNRQAQCRFGKYNPDLPLSFQQLYEQMKSVDFAQEFIPNFNGREHTLVVAGNQFSNSQDQEEYLESIIIICREFDDYVPFTLPYFGFDTSPPNMAIVAEPNPTRDPSFLGSQLSITTDDLSVCKYSNRDTQAQEFFLGEDYFDIGSYKDYREIFIEYWAEDELDDVQEISCTNLAGSTTEETIVIEVQPEYSQQIRILNEGEYYTALSGQVLLEVETDLYASCQYRLDPNDEFIPLEMVNPFLGLQGTLALATKHERQVFVDEGEVQVEVVCNMLYDWFGSEQYQYATFVQDSQAPQLEVNFYDKTCSLDSLKANIAATDASTKIVSLEYAVSVDGAVLRELTSVPDPWSTFNTFIDLSSYQGGLLNLFVVATDEAGNVNEVILTSEVTDNTHPLCDDLAPSATYELKPIWKGYDLLVSCQDDPSGSGCADSYDYALSETRDCAELFSPWSYDVTNSILNSGTLCFRSYDLRPNYAPTEILNIEIDPNCYNYEWDPGEEGIDCGGVCSFVCEDVPIICENNIKDDYEEGVDCGGVCQNIRSCVTCSGPNCDASCTNNKKDDNEEGVDCGGVCASSCEEPIDPNAPLEIILVSPQFGIAQEKTFNLELLTSKPSVCKQGYSAPLRPSELSEWYDRLDDFSETGGITHRVTMSSVDIARSGEDPDENVYPWIIICEEGGNYYDYPLERLGYDTTPAALNLDITENPILNPGDISTTIQVSSDDETACTYIDKRGNTVYFTGEDISNPETYDFSKSQRVSYEGPDLVDYLQTISCRNLAGWTSEVEDRVFVELENQIQINVLTEKYLDTSSIPLEVETVPDARCKYKILDGGIELDFTQTGSTSHFTSVAGLVDGEHEILITCTNLGTGFIGSTYARFVVDTQAPRLDILTRNPTCSLNEISATFLGEDDTTEIQEYTYDIVYQGEFVASGVGRDGNILLEELPLVDTGVYTIRGTATDTLGQSVSASTQVIASSDTDVRCDFTSPSGSLFIQEVWGGVEVQISCIDGESGCGDYYSYGVGERCEDTSNLLVGSLTNENPLFLDEQGEFCAYVYDKANNPSQKLSREIRFIPHCFNGFEDPSEEGVDCGGVCGAECGTCFNSVKDQYEEGVDCGGVCSSISTCGGTPNDPADFEIIVLNPLFGIDNSKEIELSVFTTRDAVCRHGYFADINNINIDDRYRLFESFDTTGQQQHRSTLRSDDVPQLNFNLDEDETSWGIICLEDETHHLVVLPRFGFDVSDPVLSLNVAPENIQDPADMTTLLSVQSDDEVVCTYLDRFGDTRYFSGQNVDQAGTYQTSMQATIPFWGYQEDSFTQEVTCRNIAQTNIQESQTISIQADNTLELSITMQEYYGRNDLVRVQAQTNVAAYCEYQIDTIFLPMSSTGQTDHQHVLELPEGEYTLSILCQSIGLGLSAVEDKTFTIDRSSPRVELFMPEETCSLNALRFGVLVDGEGSPLESFTYQVTDGIDILAQGEASTDGVEVSIDMSDNQEYFVSVQAQDAAGNLGQVSRSTRASETSNSCDELSPQIEILLETRENGVHATISCIDGQSGCTNYFGYRTREEDSYGLGYYDIDLPLLFRESTTLQARVYDNAGNFADGEEIIPIEPQCFNGFEDPNEEGVDCGGICTQQCLTCNNGIQDPNEEGVDCGGICTQSCQGSGSLTIDMLSPLFGVSKTKSIFLEVETNYPAVCRSGYDTQSNLELRERYTDLEEFDTTDSLLHSTEIRANQVSQLNALATESLTSWIVICSSDTEYSSLEIPLFGFDTTDAELDIIAQPNPVVDPSIMRSELLVLSDDPVVCTHLDENDNSVYFPNNDISNMNTYQTTQRSILSYWGVTDDVDEQLIICRNLAGEPTLEEVNIRINLDSSVRMTFILDEYTTENDVILDVSTLVDTYCTYSTSHVGPSVAFSITGAKEHQSELFLEEGKHTIEVRCVDQETGDVGIGVQEITVDTQEPELRLLANGASCGLNTFILTAQAEGTGSPLSTYEYALYDGTQLLLEDESSTKDLRISLDGTQEGQTYELKVAVEDAAGNQKEESLYFLATDSSHPLCDETAPRVSSSVEEVWGGVEISLECEDDESGCASEYSYSSSCEEYILADYNIENPYFVDKEGVNCYRVYDNAGNFADGEIEVSYVARCFNGVQDPDEEGVDCGGVCTAECGTCANDQQDQYELGVDCGGVCETIRSCQMDQDLEIELLSPRLGISSTQEISFSVGTSNWAYCRHGENRVNRPNSLSDWYEELNGFASTGGTVHSDSLNPNTVAGLDPSASESEVSWAVVCENQGNYAYETFMLGYDTTSPNLNVIVEPNPLEDASDMTAILGVLSDDPVICTYLDEEGRSTYFRGNDVDEVASFSRELSTSISYWNKEEARQVITCRNLALLTASEEVVVDIQPNQEIQVDILTDNLLNQRTFLLEVQSSVAATCRYDIGEGFVFFEMKDSGSHTQLIELYQGSHEVVVSCSDNNGNSGYATKIITIDYTKPKLDVLVSPESCSLNEVRATIFSDGTFSDFVSYDYTLKQGDNQIISGQSTVKELEIQTGLSLGEEYELEITAYDELGNTDTTNAFFVATQASASSCDTQSPVGSAVTEFTWKGAETTINCIDQESGCSTYFDYSFQESGFCGEASTYGDLSLDNPLLSTQSTTLCYSVYDNANNKFSDNTFIEVETSCYNGFEDPAEEGIDCGEICGVSCSVCANGIQDSYEEGIDCGGICDQSCNAPFKDVGFAVNINNPRFGIASTKDFIFEIQSTKTASCRHGYLANARPDTIANWYLTLDEFERSDGKKHSVNIQSDTISQLSAQGDSALTSWVVICLHQDEYFIQELPRFGYDTSRAVLEIRAEPNPVVDPGNAITTFIVESDEPVACTYQDKEGITHFFEGVDVRNIETYKNRFTQVIEHWGDDQLSYSSTISCRNLAQWLSEGELDVSIALTNSLGITSNIQNEYGTKRVVINASTQQLATCQFRFDENDEYENFALFSTYDHQKGVDLDEGKHTVEIVCVSESTGDISRIYDTFVVDTIDPEVEIVLGSSSCSLEEIRFSIQADGTGTDIEEFEYKIFEGDTQIVSRDTDSEEVIIEVDLNEGDLYGIELIAYDEAGNSQITTETFRATDYDPATCDKTNPMGSIEIQNRWNGLEVDIICEDDEDCASTFDYLYSESGLCEEEYILGSYASDLPLIITQSTTLCYRVYDEAGNSYEGIKDIQYEQACFNGVEDPSEEGVDCGGTCIAECGTCSNFIKDSFEEGIDCGGVCETIRSCSDIEGLYSEFIDTDLDGMDDSWEEFHFGDLEEEGIADYDEDGLSNIEEYRARTNPTKKDSDEDGLSDFFEIRFFGDQDETPEGDPDGDSLNNLIEYSIGTNPLAKDVTDADKDGLADQWEEFYFGNLDEEATGDYDDDGLTNLEEYVAVTNPRVFTQRDTCSEDNDCDYGYKCDYTFTCVVDEFLNEDIFDEVEPGVSVVGILLLILGLLFMGGGIGYIIHSRRQYKEKEEKINAKERAKQQEALALAKKREEAKREEFLAKKRAAQEKARKERLEERKIQRLEVLKSFTEKPAQTSEKNVKPVIIKSSKLDEGLEEEFVDVRDLGKGKKQESVVVTSQKNVFDNLHALTKKKKK